MTTRILFAVALVLAAMVVHKVATLPKPEVPAEDAAFMAAVIEANTIGIRQERSDELQNEITAYNAKRRSGDAAIWTPPAF